MDNIEENIDNKRKEITFLTSFNIDHQNLIHDVNSAHIFISHLVLEPGWMKYALNLTSNPLFLIEYQLPDHVSNLCDKKQTLLFLDTNRVVKALNKCVQGDHVVFNHYASFFIEINHESLQYWLETELIFKIMTWFSGEPRSTELTGNCSLAMKHVLQSNGLNLVQSLTVKDAIKRNIIGQLFVSVELLSNSQDSFDKSPMKSHIIDKTTYLRGAQIDEFQACLLAQQQQQVHKTLKQGSSHLMNFKSFPLSSIIIVSKASHLSFSSDSFMNKIVSSRNCIDSNKKSHQQVIKNFYLVMKMFWCSETDSAISQLIWGSSSSAVNFIHVAHLQVNEALLERLKCNFAILEVWSKQHKGGNDCLIGLVKLSLHQFFLSYHEPVMAQSFLHAKVPVIACDNWVAVRCPFNDKKCGELLITFAMGSASQIAALRKAKDMIVQPLIQHHCHQEEERCTTKIDNSLEHHQFEIIIEDLRELHLPDGYIWSDADLLVEYQFPSVISGSMNGELELKKFRTTSTMAVAQCTLRHRMRHHLFLADGIPLQHRFSLCTASLPVQLWMRHYLPNVREECIAIGVISLDKLCALISLNQGSAGGAAAQRFKVTLVSTKISEGKIATLDMTLKYRIRQGAPLSSVNYLQHQQLISAILPSSNQCTLCVNVLRATGLKMAALCATKMSDARERSSLEYSARVGVNAYCRFRLSFQRTIERSTLPVARTFSPEWAHCSELALALLWPSQQRGTSGPICLAELLEKGNLEVQVWHREPAPERPVKCATRNKDTLLGMLTLPLSSLLCRAALRGWFPLRTCNMQDSVKVEGYGVGTRYVGGLELLLGWQEACDCKKILQSAHLTRYTSLAGELEQLETQVEETSPPYLNITLTLKSLNVAESLCLRCGQERVPNDARLSFLYKMYGQVDAVQTEAFAALVNPETQRIRINCFYRRIFRFKMCASLRQWLLQPHLEVQVWLHLQHQDDILIGSAYLDLSIRTHHRTSGYFALLRPQCATLEDSQLRASLSICAAEASLEEETAAMPIPLSDQQHRQRLSDTMTFPLHVLIDQAARLQWNTSFEVTPLQKYYVTLDAAQCDCETGQFVTPLRSATDGSHGHCVTWFWEQQASLDKEILHCKEKSLHFRLWQQQSETNCQKDKMPHRSAYPLPQDRLLGIASVDISPMMAGLHQLMGWYHITNSRQEVIGQLKLGVTPLNHADLNRVNIPFSLTESHQKESENTDTNNSLLLRNLHGHLADLDVLNKRLLSRISPCEEVVKKETINCQEKNGVDSSNSNTDGDFDDVLRRARQLLDFGVVAECKEVK